MTPTPYVLIFIGLTIIAVSAPLIVRMAPFLLVRAYGKRLPG